MNEKRFTFVCNDENCRFKDNGETIDCVEVVNLLNTLHEENQQSKHYKLYEDNKRLQTIIADLKEENEQLRKTIKEVIELLLEEVDLFSDKATEHDIIAYMEMNEFDNKDAYYMCVSTKKAIKLLQRYL